MDFWGSNHLIGLNLFGLTTVVGSIIGVYFFLKITKHLEWNKNNVLTGILLFFAGSIVGTMVHQVVFPTITIGVTGGLLVGIGVLMIYLRKKSLPIARTLDLAAPFFILSYGISRIGFGVFGLPTSSDPLWAIRIDGFLMHPTQAYEFIMCFLLFGYLFLRQKSYSYHGQAILHGLIGLLLINSFVEIFREKESAILFLSLNQVISLVLLVFVFVGMKLYKNKVKILSPANVERYEIAKVWFYIWSLTLGSIISYYLLQSY